MTDRDDRDAEENASRDEDTSLEDLVSSIERRRDDEPSLDSDDESLADLADSIRRRRAERDPQPSSDDETLGDLSESVQRRQGGVDPEPTSGSDDTTPWEFADSGSDRGSQSDRDLSAIDDQAASPSPAPESDTGALADLEDDSSVLFLAPLASEGTDRWCIDHLTPTSTVVDNVLLVTVTRSVDDRLRAWRQHATATPSNLAVVSVGDGTRSAGESAEITIGGAETDLSIRNVPDPSDLARLGITLTRTLSGWDGGHSRLCVHSLTALLQYVDPQHLFRFLHVLRGKCDSLGAAGHYHMDPEAHEGQTIRLFTSLFETVVRVDDDGTVEITAGE